MKPGTFNPGPPPYRNVTRPLADYDTIVVLTGGGDDRVEVQSSYPSLTRTQIGSPDTAVYMNVYLGPGRGDFINPIRTSLGGTDYVSGDAGRDLIQTEVANDVLIGGPGRDLLYGGGGTDLLIGGKGRDSLHGGSGVPDLMLGGPGFDSCSGNPGDRVAKCERIRAF